MSPANVRGLSALLRPRGSWLFHEDHRPARLPRHPRQHRPPVYLASRFSSPSRRPRSAGSSPSRFSSCSIAVAPWKGRPWPRRSVPPGPWCRISAKRIGSAWSPSTTVPRWLSPSDRSAPNKRSASGSIGLRRAQHPAGGAQPCCARNLGDDQQGAAGVSRGEHAVSVALSEWRSHLAQVGMRIGQDPAGPQSRPRGG